jgi:hypothetical protein
VKINIHKSKITVFKKGGRFSKNEKWRLGREEIQVTNEKEHFGVTVDSIGSNN